MPALKLPLSATATASVWNDRTFLLIWFAMLCSTAATFLFLLAVSVQVLASTGSNLAAAAVFACHWILPVLGARLIGRVITEMKIKRVLLWAEVSAALAAGLVAVLFDFGLGVVLGILTLRGFTEALTKSGRTVAIKIYMQGPLLSRAAALFNTSQFAGSALGALFGVGLIQLLSLEGLALVAIIAYLVAGLCYAGLGDEHAPANRDGSVKASVTAREILREHPALFRAYHYLLLTTAVFQGYHTVARTALPTSHLGLAPETVVHVSLLSSITVLLGALFVGSFWSGSLHSARVAAGLVGATAVAMLLPLYAPGHAWSFAGYGLFMFVFEIGFVKFQKTVVVLSPITVIGHITAGGAALGTAGMAVMVVVAGYGADRFSLTHTSLAVMVLAVIWSLAIELSVPRNAITHQSIDRAA